MGRGWLLVSEGVAITPGPDDRVAVAPGKVGTEGAEGAAKQQRTMEEDRLIYHLLAGFSENKNGRPVTAYPPPNSREEREARTALARQLREGRLIGIARELLALAIDPTTPSQFPGLQPILVVQLRAKARRSKSTWARDLLVVAYVRSWLRKNPGKEEAARAAAEKHFKLKRSRIAEIWKQHKLRSG